MWIDYQRESLGREVLLSEVGFLTYRIINEECYIVDCYLRPAFRGGDSYKGLFDLVCEKALLAGCKYLKGSVYMGYNGMERSLCFQIKLGFKIDSIEPGVIWLKKEL